MKHARAISVLMPLVLGLVMACSGTKESPDTLMTRGVDSLYTKNDPETAAVAFRKVLAMNPDHYGANYQLAVALDRGGKPAEARPFWEKSLAMAVAIRDETTADTARKRLGQPGPSPEDAAMKAGLAALYEKKDAVAAAGDFRRVLELNPSHYGATFQLAKALDQAGNPAEARPFWEKALKMAEGYKDAETARVAKERLARRP
jgi:tetratricopeptide (TPR) repeat protein